MDKAVATFFAVLILGLIFGMVGCSMWVMPNYSVWQQGKAGEARLREAESSRQIKIEEAKADLEAAKLYRGAEVERAHGVAEANEIIGNSLDGNDEYLRYLWIDRIGNHKGEVIYIPTEAGLPILEATRKIQP